MLTPREFLSTTTVRTLTDACERELAAMRADFETQLARVIDESQRALPSFEVSIVRARQAEEDAQRAVADAIARRREAEAAREECKAANARRERDLRANSQRAQDERVDGLRTAINDAWHTYARKHRPTLLGVR